MIANYTNHAANERTFLAWIRTGLAVAAFGFFLVKLSIFVDAVDGGSIPHLPAEAAGAGVAVATRHTGLAMVGIGIAVIARSRFAFVRTRRAIDREEVCPDPVVPCGDAAFHGACDRRADFLHQPHTDLTFATRFHFKADRRSLRWI
jgi:putative membrane protein